MDKWVTVTKPSTSRGANCEKEKSHTSHRFNPYGLSKPKSKLYERNPGDSEEKKQTGRTKAPLLKDGVLSSLELTKHILDTLSDESNPITHSDIARRSDHVVSSVTGHQRSERTGPRAEHFDDRTKKLKEKASEKGPESATLEGTAVYINGYLNETTDIEMKRILAMAGARVLNTPSSATHIITSQQLSAAKTHKILTTKARIVPQVVKPEWVIDSIKAGRRLPERKYTIMKTTLADKLLQIQP